MEFDNTEFKTALGHLEVTIYHKILDLCEMAGRIRDESSDIFTRSTYERFTKRCIETKDAYYEPALADFVRATKFRGALGRVKRFDPLTVSVAVGIYSLCATGVGTATYFGHPRSPFHTVPAIENTVEELIKNVTALQSMADVARNISGQVASALQLTNERVEKLRLDVKTAGNTAADMSWQASELHSRIKETSEDLEALADGYRRGIVPLKAVARLTNNKKLAQLNHAGVQWESMLLQSRELADGIYIRFNVLLAAEDTLILRTNPFKIWTDWPAQPRMLRYDGPAYVSHNTTANCTIGIATPKGHIVTQWCTMENFSDPELQRWVDTDPDQDYYEIKPTLRGAKIYCLGRNITVNNDTFVCPPWPITTSEKSRISVGNLSFVNLQFNISTTASRPSPFEFRVLNDSLEIDSSYLLNARIIQDINASNKRWSSIESTGKPSTIGSLVAWAWPNISLLGDYTWVIAGAAGASLMLTIFCMLVKREPASKPQSGANSTHVEYNVYNQTPAPQPTPDYRELSGFLAKLVFTFLKNQQAAQEYRPMTAATAPRGLDCAEESTHESRA